RAVKRAARHRLSWIEAARTDCRCGGRTGAAGVGSPWPPERDGGASGGVPCSPNGMAAPSRRSSIVHTPFPANIAHFSREESERVGGRTSRSLHASLLASPSRTRSHAESVEIVDDDVVGRDGRTLFCGCIDPVEEASRRSLWIHGHCGGGVEPLTVDQSPLWRNDRSATGDRRRR